MSMRTLLFCLLLVFPCLFAFRSSPIDDFHMKWYIASAKDVKMYWKHDHRVINNFNKLKSLEPGLTFAMNGGMFHDDYSPVGLYVENGVQIHGLVHASNPNYNFGIRPQGVFLIRDTVAEVVPIDGYRPAHVKYATESGPMLVVASKINPLLPKSESKTIRNGVGILPGGKILMACSRDELTFQEFASYFLQMHCTSALYLDGAVSEAYSGDFEDYNSFGVIIGVVK